MTILMVKKLRKNIFYVSNFHLHGLDGNHYESYFGTGGPINSDNGNDSQIKKPFVFKPIFKVLEPWEGTDSHSDYNNVPKTIASMHPLISAEKMGFMIATQVLYASLKWF